MVAVVSQHPDTTGVPLMLTANIRGTQSFFVKTPRVPRCDLSRPTNKSLGEMRNPSERLIRCPQSLREIAAGCDALALTAGTVSP